MPKDTQKTLPTQTRLDLRDLATLTRYYKSIKVHCKTRSELVSTGINDLLHILAKNKLVQPITTYDEAVALLKSEGIDLGKKQRERVLENIVIENQSVSDALDNDPRLNESGE